MFSGVINMGRRAAPKTARDGIGILVKRGKILYFRRAAICKKTEEFRRSAVFSKSPQDADNVIDNRDKKRGKGFLSFPAFFPYVSRNFGMDIGKSAAGWKRRFRANEELGMMNEEWRCGCFATGRFDYILFCNKINPSRMSSGVRLILLKSTDCGAIFQPFLIPNSSLLISSRFLIHRTESPALRS